MHHRTRAGKSSRPPVGPIAAHTPEGDRGAFQSWAPGTAERGGEDAAQRVRTPTATGGGGADTVPDASPEEVRAVFAASLRALGLHAYASVLTRLTR